MPNALPAPARLSRSTATALAVLAALCLSAPADARWPSHPASGGVQVSTLAGDQQSPSACTDGAGGMIVAWNDNRPGALGYDIYIQRIDAKGQPVWAVNGVVVCNAAGDQNLPTVTPDGSGGAIVCWQDARSMEYDIYAQRILSNGTPLWSANGVVVCNATNTQSIPQIVGAGPGSAIICWQDIRSGNTDLYAQRVNVMGFPSWAANGVALSQAANNQVEQRMIPDGTGGAIVCWTDLRDFAGAVYAAKVTSVGTLPWALDGALLSLASDTQSEPSICSDGAGGACVAFTDYKVGNPNISAQRIGVAGSTLWGNEGVIVCDNTSLQGYPAAASDGDGGIYVAWADGRTARGVYVGRISATGVPQMSFSGIQALYLTQMPFEAPIVLEDGVGGIIVGVAGSRETSGWGDVYAQHVNWAGTLLWSTGTIPVWVSTAIENQQRLAMVSDQAGGMICVWDDFRSLSHYDIYAQRVDAFGTLGREPEITRVRDVPNDQGGHVAVQWTASASDVVPGNAITGYAIFRQVPASLAAARMARGERASRLSEAGTLAPGALLADGTATQAFFWEYVTQVGAYGFASYSYTAATPADSVAGSNPYTKFMIAALEAGSVYHSSVADSGYSVDNLPPSPPAPFAATYSAGVASLHWSPSGAPDLAGYRLYRGSSASFTPSPANLVASVPDTGYADAAGAPYYYKLSAVDSHGNESVFLLALPAGALAVGDPASAAALALRGVWPNPSSGTTLVRFALPREGRVQLAIHDAAGRLVRRLVDESRPAGDHGISWDGRDDRGGALPGGLYFARLEAGGERRVTRIARLD